MSTTLTKSRWEAWENACLRAAFIQKIQHKIMAIALGRTVPSVSKKIKTLGLRAPSSTRGRIKGEKQPFTRTEKAPKDLEKMIDILKTYAPLKCSQAGYLALKKGRWPQSQLNLRKNINKKSCFSSIDQYNVSFSFVKPLDFILSNKPLTRISRDKIVSGDPIYIPLCYVEQWADAEGFQRTKGTLRDKGLSYWKNGSYFSQTQLLMHVNRLRSEHNLQPLALIEEENGPLA